MPFLLVLIHNHYSNCISSRVTFSLDFSHSCCTCYNYVVTEDISFVDYFYLKALLEWLMDIIYFLRFQKDFCAIMPHFESFHECCKKNK